MGGTFDPIHRGHVDAALAAVTRLGLDRMVLMPAHVPPHRALQPTASPFHRFAMTALAALEHDALEASDLELRTPGASYTARTLAAFHESGIPASLLFFVLGTDAFADIATWYDYPRLLDAAHFVVVSRPGHAHGAALARVPELAGRLVDLRHGRAGDGTIPAEPSVMLVSADTTDVSSTELRRRLATGTAVESLVPPAVARHIARHHLYQPPVAATQLHD